MRRLHGFSPFNPVVATVNSFTKGVRDTHNQGIVGEVPVLGYSLRFIEVSAR